MTDDLAAQLARAAREGSAARSEAASRKRDREQASRQRAQKFEKEAARLLAELARTAPDMFGAAGIPARTFQDKTGWLLIIQRGYRGRSGITERVDLLLTEHRQWFVRSGATWRGWQVRVPGGNFTGGQFVSLKAGGKSLSLPSDPDTLRRRFEETLVATAKSGNRE